MGAPMALSLQRSGAKLVVYDRNESALQPFRELGVTIARSPIDIANQAEVVFSCLPTAAISRDVGFGEQGVVHGRAIKTYIEMSTNGKDAIEEIGEKMQAAGIGFLDAPISKEAGAKNKYGGQAISVMLSGSPGAFEAAKPYLEIIAVRVFRLGDKPGQAQLAKLVNNYLSFTARIASFEGMILGTKAGLDPEILLEVINGSSGRNSTTIDKFPPILSGTFKHVSELAIPMKDVAAYLKEAERLEVQSRLGHQVLGTMQEAYDAGYSQGLRIAEYMEKQAGVQVRSRPK
ncbi:3-hydroxyisobutyrate dehydrogenase [Paraburkholderia caribensis]|nr:3-hydroxyisobutyrate dehydrogenase [Paraburkholderia caribensis]